MGWGGCSTYTGPYSINVGLYKFQLALMYKASEVKRKNMLECIVTNVVKMRCVVLIRTQSIY